MYAGKKKKTIEFCYGLKLKWFSWTGCRYWQVVVTVFYFLSLSYIMLYCISVRYARPCTRHKQNIMLNQPIGYIAPYSDTNYPKDGSDLCSWVIQGQPGQKVNITLISLFSSSTDHVAYNSAPCRLKIMISEGNDKKVFELCDLSTPYLLYTSRDHSVSVNIPYSARHMDVIQKILKYQSKNSQFYNSCSSDHKKVNLVHLYVVYMQSFFAWSWEKNWRIIIGFFFLSLLRFPGMNCFCFFKFCIL